MSENIRGRLYKEKDGTIRIDCPKLQKHFDLIIPTAYFFAFDEKLLASPDYTFEIVGKHEGEYFMIEGTPTIVADIEDLNGLLNEKDGQLYIGEQKAKLGRTKIIHESEFDRQGLEYYINSEVLAQGHFEDDIFIVNALLQKGLITSKGDAYPPPPKMKGMDPFKFVLNEVPKNEFSQRK